MKLPNRSLHIFLLALLVATSALALTPTEWQRRQSITVATPGLSKIILPAETFDSAQPTLADLRVLDPIGQEVPYLLDREQVSREPARDLVPKSFRTTQNGDSTQLLIETGTADPIDSIDLKAMTPVFLKAAHVEISSDGKEWQSLGAAVPLFRQLDVEQLRLLLSRRKVEFIRVTIDDFRSRKVDFTGAMLRLSSKQAAPPRLTPLGAKITRREEFAGESVLTVELDGRNVLLAGISFDTKDPLFMRRVSVAIRDVRGAVSSERTIGAGTIYRVGFDGVPVRAEVEIPLDFSIPARELLVHIHNGDSPPLKVGGVQAVQHSVSLFFNAAQAGDYTLLSGNLQAEAPQYDLAAFTGEMRLAHASSVVPGNVVGMPDYHPREPLLPVEAPLPDVPLAGAPLDTAAWPRQRPITISRAGVQELELDPEAMAQSLPDGSDLRVLYEGRQMPYVVERPELFRSLTLAPADARDPKRPSASVWKVRLPNAGLPIQRLVLTTSTPLFQRKFRIYEKQTAPDGRFVKVPLITDQWSRTPEADGHGTKAFILTDRLLSDTIWIETDNEDNPAIALDAVQAVYPVVRLIFKVSEPDGFSLAYGNKAAKAPRYDLSLVAARLLTASRHVAALGADGQKATSPKGSFLELNSGYIFWIALALVVAALLVVVAKLLPKPPPAPEG